jgi:hypothetical protein
MQEDTTDTDDETLGTVVLLSEEKASLSNLVIADYFSSDGRRDRGLESSDHKPERSILDESSGDEDLRQSGDVPTKASEQDASLPRPHEPESATSPVESSPPRAKRMLEAMLSWEVVLSVLVVAFALAHCMWMWNLVELSALSLALDD